MLGRFKTPALVLGALLALAGLTQAANEPLFKLTDGTNVAAVNGSGAISVTSVDATKTPVPTATPSVGCAGYPCGAGLTTIGPTFATVDTTINNVSFTTCVTLGSTLTAAKKYLISANITLAGSALNDNITTRIFDSTNSVEIASASNNDDLASGRIAMAYTIPYGGYAGSPTIVLQAINNSTNGGACQATATGAAANKATQISATETT